MTTFRISLVGENDFDLTISVVMPEDTCTVLMIRRIVRDMAITTFPPAVLAGEFVRRMLDLTDQYDDELTVSNRPDYSGYVFTVNLVNQQVCVQDFDNYDNVARIDFADLEAWAG